MRLDRDLQIFLILIVCLLLLNFLPLTPPLRILFFILIVAAQALFLYKGFTRWR